MNSYADGYMRGKVVKEVGALLDNILVEEITTPTIIKLEFGPSYDTIRELRQQDTSKFLRPSGNSATSSAIIFTKK